MACIIECLFSKLRDLGHVTGTAHEVDFSVALRVYGSIVFTIICIFIYKSSGVIFSAFKSYK